MLAERSAKRTRPSKAIAGALRGLMRVPISDELPQVFIFAMASS